MGYCGSLEEIRKLLSIVLGRLEEAQARQVAVPVWGYTADTPKQPVIGMMQAGALA